VVENRAHPRNGGKDGIHAPVLPASSIGADRVAITAAATGRALFDRARGADSRPVRARACLFRICTDS
jgi:hypothetical protein